MNKTPLTRQILKDNFEFNIIDCGEFWVAKKGNFKLIQPKSAIIQYELSFFHCFNESTIENISDRSINTVEELQKYCKERSVDIKFTM